MATKTMASVPLPEMAFGLGMTGHFLGRMPPELVAPAAQMVLRLMLLDLSRVIRLPQGMVPREHP